jgi:outer membrane protein assembly factor BamB
MTYFQRRLVTATLVLPQQSEGGIVASSPTVYDGVVLVAAQDLNIHAYNATTGQLLWTKPGGSFTSKLTVVNGVTYVGRYDQAGSSEFVAYNVKTGSQIWAVPFPCFLQTIPAVANGTVFAECNGLLYAVNASNGSVVWTQPGAGSPSVANGIVYTAKSPANSTDNNLVAYNVKTGALVWGKRLGIFVFEDTPVIANGRLYVYYQISFGTNEDVFNASNGKLIWQKTFSGYAHCKMSTYECSYPIANGVQYILMDDLNSTTTTLAALDIRTGATLWSFSLPGPDVINIPSVANSRLYVWVYYPTEVISFYVPGL